MRDHWLYLVGKHPAPGRVVPGLEWLRVTTQPISGRQNPLGLSGDGPSWSYWGRDRCRLKPSLMYSGCREAAGSRQVSYDHWIPRVPWALGNPPWEEQEVAIQIPELSLVGGWEYSAMTLNLYSARVPEIPSQSVSSDRGECQMEPTG